MLTQRDIYSCAWHTILGHGATRAEAVAEDHIVEMRDKGMVKAAEMWTAVKACIPELLADPEAWNNLPNDIAASADWRRD